MAAFCNGASSSGILLDPDDRSAADKRVLVVGGSPEPSRPEFVARLAYAADAVCAVDRGLDTVLAAGLELDLFCGDGDTASPASLRALDRLVECGICAVERYDPAKDFTDLSLALRAVRERWGRAHLTATCFAGGRPDHLLAVMGCLARADAASVALAEDGYEGRILRSGEEWVLAGCEGAPFSFVALSEGACVTEKGMRWELDRAPVALLGDLGVSNEVVAPEARVACHRGTVAAWCFHVRG